ncbi:hypothetical protein KW797_00280 [Candidatus Parcubacteria bacterium]|nr:hypothetical protein [Candidatus Parcubacteria bacterium]
MPIGTSKTPSGPGQTVLTSPAATKGQPIEPLAQEINRTKTLQEQKAAEAENLDDTAVLQALLRHHALSKPTLAKRFGQAIDALSEGTIGLSSDLRDPRIKRAEEQAYPKSGFQKGAEMALQTAGMFVRYGGLEAGSVAIGNSLRSVKAVDEFYKAYPYAAKALVTNVGVNASDAAAQQLTGHDYTSKDFMLNLLLQGGFDQMLSSQKVRILTHLDNEAKVLESRLGRPARPDEFLTQVAGQFVPGQSFTYGHLFGEQRLSFMKNPRQFLGEAAPHEIERRLAFLKSGDQTGPSAPNMVKLSDVKTDPSRFQFRDNVHPELGYQEENVSGILEGQGFQPTEVRPLEIGRFPGPDGQQQQYLVNGHNTLELLKRQGLSEGEARFIDFPNEEAAQNFARKANMASKRPELLQQVSIAGSMFKEGKTIEQIASELGRIKVSDTKRLLHIGNLAPEVQRQVSAGLIDEQLAGVLGEYTAKLKLEPGTQNQLVDLVMQDKFTPQGLREWLSIMGKGAVKGMEAQTLFGTETLQQGVVPLLDRILTQKRELTATVNRIKNAKQLIAEGILTKQNLKQLKAAETEKQQLVDVLDFLVLKKSGVEAPSLPDGVTPEMLARVQASLADSSVSDSAMVTNSPGSRNIAIPSGESGVNPPPSSILEARNGTMPSSDISRRYLLPDESLTNLSKPIADSSYVTKIVALSKENRGPYQKDLQELLPEAEINVQVKGGARLKEKVALYRLNGRDPREIADVLRAEAVLPESDVYPSFTRLRGQLEQAGFKLREEPRDYFEKPDNGYRGINMKLELPNGQFAELQIHTPLSRQIRETNHPLYEELRVLGRAEGKPEIEARYRELELKMQRQSDAMWKAQSDGIIGGGQGGTFDPLTPPAGDFGNLKDVPGLRIRKMTSVEAKQAFAQIMESYPELLISRSRGVISHAETVAAAARVGMTRERIVGMKLGTVLNNEELQAARHLMAADLEDLELLRKAATVEAKAGETTIAQQETLKGMFEQELGRLALQGARVSGVASETGRALNSLKIKMAPLERAQKKFLDVFQTAPKRVKEAMFQYAQEIDLTNEAELHEFLTRFNHKGLLEAVAEFTQMAKLYSFLPQARNFVSNLGWQVVQPGWRGYVAAIDMAKSALTGAPRTRFAGEAYQEIKGQTQGMLKAFGIKLAGTEEADARIMGLELRLGDVWKALGDEMYTNHGGAGNLEDMIGRLPAIRGTTGNAWVDSTIDATGKVVRLPGRVLNAVDVAFYRWAYHGEIATHVYRIAKSEGLSGEALKTRMAELLQFPSEELLQTAHQQAKHRIFQSDLGTIAGGINRTIRFSPVLGPLSRTGPLSFFKTPVNIFKITTGPFNPMLLARELRAGGGSASEGIARSSIGLITTGLLFKYALDGRITGASPDDPKLRDELQQNGWQRYSVLLDGTYYYYNSTDPLSAPLMYASALADAYRQTGRVDPQTITQMLFNITKGTLDKTYVKGLSSLFAALTNPKQDGPAWIRDYVSGLLPMAPGRMVLSVTDTDAQGNQIQRQGNGVLGNLQAQIPGLAQSLPPRLDYQGRVLTKAGSAAGRVFNPLSPTELLIPPEEITQMQDDYYKIQGLAKDARNQAAEQRQQAREFLATQAGLPPELIKQNLKVLFDKNPEIAQILQDLIKQKTKKAGTLPYTLSHDVLLNAPTDARAAFIWDKIKTLKKEGKLAELAPQLEDWKRKKILTDATETAVKKLIQAELAPK